MAPLPHSDTALFLPHLCTTSLHLGSLKSIASFYTRTPRPTGQPSFRLAEAIFEPILFPYKYPNNFIPVILPTLLVSYLEAHLNDSQRWLTELRIAINVSKSTAIIFARAGRGFIEPRPVTLFGEPIEWVDTTRYLGVTLYTRLTWSPHIVQVRRRAAQRL
jgi:hypothetical protein